MRSKDNATPSTKLRRQSSVSSTKLCPTWNKLCSRRLKNASPPRRKKHPKRRLRRNGKRSVQIRTCHGSFDFAEQRFVWGEGAACHFLEQTQQEPDSIGLQESALYYCNRLSFGEVASLLERLTGEPLACAQTLHNWAQRKAAEVEAALLAEVKAAQALPFPAVAHSVDLYNAHSEEVLVLMDGIGVKAQKPKRVPTRPQRHEPDPEQTTEQTRRRVETDVMLLQGQDGSFRYLCQGLAPGASSVSLPERAAAYLRQEWGARETPLPVVAITDGARSIRLDLGQLFGTEVPIILDWYHLVKRVYEHLSMVAHSKAQRERLQHQVVGFLWQGQVPEALLLLAAVPARNGKALQELVGYLEKHAHEIIDYQRRAQSGKCIGSGRMEKAVDQVVGMRQKKKGMSWSETGSRALALLKTVELNGQWSRLWQAAAAAT